MGILIADSGGSTTDWAYIGNDAQVHKCTTAGMNPNYTSDEALLSITHEAFLDIPIKQLTGIYLYSAGVSKPENRMRIEKIICQRWDSNIYVETDLLGSARALFDSDKGITCILGTGSNAGYYNGSTFEFQSPSMGYLLDDPGSGFDMGKQVLKDFFYEQLPEEIVATLNQRYSLTRNSVLQAFYYEAFPNRFIASFASVLSDFRELPYTRQVVTDSLRRFVQSELNVVMNKEKAPIGFTGSIASAFQDELEQVLKENNLGEIQIVSKPIDRLIKYHMRHLQ